MTRLGTSPLALAVLAAGTMLGGLACTGSVSDALPNGMTAPGEPGPNGRPNPGPPGNPTPTTPATAEDTAGPLPLRRLTINEYNNTVRDLIGADMPGIDAQLGISADVEAFEHGFLKGSTVGSANDARLFSHPVGHIADGGDGPAGRADAPGLCGSGRHGRRELREEVHRRVRPARLPAAAQQRREGRPAGPVHEACAGPGMGLTFPEAIRTLISGMLQSPMFTYRWELGPEPSKGPGGLVRLDSYGMASRLSYTILASMPDRGAVHRGRRRPADQPEKIAEHARRLLASEKAKIGLREFIVQWMWSAPCRP